MSKQIRTIPEWEDLLLWSISGEVIVFFKHSATCGPSAEALENLEEAEDEGEFTFYYTVCQTSHELWTYLKLKVITGYKHESPQIFILAGGKVWAEAHHYKVTPLWVHDQLLALRGNAVG